MTNEQAYVDGFVKRAAEYGFDETEAMDILKQAIDAPVQESTTSVANSSGAKTVFEAGKGKDRYVQPAKGPGELAISNSEAKRLNIPIPGRAK